MTLACQCGQIRTIVFDHIKKRVSTWCPRCDGNQWWTH